MMRKEDMVAQLNDLLGMEHRLSHWQFGQIRKYELQEMVSKVYSLRLDIDEYKERLQRYEGDRRIAEGYRKD